MHIESINQAYLFFIFILNGFCIGILFDLFRILRKSFKTPNFVTYVQDIIFWILTGIVLLYSIFIFNNGEIRLYIFIGILLGIVLYMILISKYVIKISVAIITFSKNIVYKILNIVLYPIKLITKIFKKILFKPISFIFINIRTFSSKTSKKILDHSLKNKKHEKKLLDKEGI